MAPRQHLQLNQYVLFQTLISVHIFLTRLESHINELLQDSFPSSQVLDEACKIHPDFTHNVGRLEQLHDIHLWLRQEMIEARGCVLLQSWFHLVAYFNLIYTLASLRSALYVILLRLLLVQLLELLPQLQFFLQNLLRLPVLNHPPLTVIISVLVFQSWDKLPFSSFNPRLFMSPISNLL